MRDIATSSSADRRARLVAALGCAAAALLTTIPAEADQTSAPVTGSSLSSAQRRAPVLFSADEVINDDQLDIVIARGHVEASQSGRTVLADVVSYNRKTDTVIATGNVSVIEEATGETLFSSYVELKSDMKDGFIRDFRMLLADRSRLAANTGARIGGTRTELYRATYSACDLCADDPTAPPLWQIQSARVVRDLDAGVIRYHNATLEFGGVPLFWTPYLSQPDPSIKRASGLLAPTLLINSALGTALDVPYFWAIDVDRDLTIEPIFTAKQSTVLGGEYRQRFSDGYIDIRGSFTDSDPNPGYGYASDSSHNTQLRGHLFADGVLDIDDNLRAGFSIRRTSDTVYLQEYRYVNTATFLTSKIDLEDFDDRDYGVVLAYAFQPLQFGQQIGIQPLILPGGFYQWAGAPLDWGGKFTTTLSTTALTRTLGLSSRRLTAETEFDLPFQGPGGQQFNLVAGLRGDGYYSSTNNTTSTSQTGQGHRAFPQIGLEWRYPFVRRDAGSTWIVEPRAAVYAAPVGGNPAKIPNNDSVAADFDDQDLFVRNRVRGYDQVDGGQRIDYGMHVNWRTDDGASVDTLVGQSYRFQHDSPFNVTGTIDNIVAPTDSGTILAIPGSLAIGDGLLRQASDYVGRVTYTQGPYFTTTYRFRFDQRDLRPQRQEIGMSFGPQWLRASVNYRQYAENLRDELLPRQQIDGSITLRATDYWSVGASGTEGLQGTDNVRTTNINVRYADECTTMILSLGQNNLRVGNYQSGGTLMLQLVLKNLGEIASGNVSAGL